MTLEEIDLLRERWGTRANDAEIILGDNNPITNTLRMCIRELYEVSRKEPRHD